MIPWNKNKKAPQISRGKKGKVPTHNGKLMVGKNHPSWKGGPVKLNCLNCGKEFTTKKAREQYSKYCSKKCMGEHYSKFYSGENHSCWIDGRSYRPYSLEFNKKLKDKTRERDDGVCKKCGRTNEEEREEFNNNLAIHHIDYNKKNNKEDNLITLCLRCNNEVNKSRKEWTNYFQNMLKKKTFLITGGTGSFGLNFTKFLLKQNIAYKIVIFSRDEYKQFNMARDLNDDRLEFIIGDIRDLESIKVAMDGVDVVVHSAAYKQIPILENNPWEGIKTNIIGSQNVITAAKESEVDKVLLISSDKAVQPINLYGASKLCAEKLFIQANQKSKTRFAIARYGNVVASRGSILENLSQTKIKLTDPRMTRFWLPLEKSFQLVMFALDNMEGGETYVPKMPSMKIIDLFKTLAPKAEIEIIGIRPGEKLHETLVTQYEASRTLKLKDYFVILPDIDTKPSKGHGKYAIDGVPLPEGFIFASDTNEEWLAPEDIKKIVYEKN